MSSQTNVKKPPTQASVGVAKTTPDARPVTVRVGESSVSALWLRPRQLKACFVFAHGAGAGMNHPFMAAAAGDLYHLGIATLRVQFPYMERGSGRPDAPALCHATIKAAVQKASKLASGVLLFAGGKSFGGRMTSQAAALGLLPDVRGLIFYGFPLHAAGKPADERGQHLSNVKIPKLFLQGTHDKLADLHLLAPLVKRLGKRATLKTIENADHSFHVPARSGRNDAAVRTALADSINKWIGMIG